MPLHAKTLELNPVGERLAVPARELALEQDLPLLRGEGLKDTWSKGRPSRLSASQRAELAQVVEIGPDRAVHGVVRWRRIDLQRLIAERFGVAYHERTVGKILHQLGFRHISARPRHPAQDERIVAEFKKTSHVR